jgi:hypothetical protein
MADQDPFWHAGMVESHSAQLLRVTNFLETVFNQPETYVSVTSHGALIKVFLEVVGHPNANFTLGTGQIIPAFITMEKVRGATNKIHATPPAPAKNCPMCTVT